MKDMNLIQSNASLKGMYRCVVEHEDNTVTDTGWMDNLILNSGLDMLGGVDDNNLSVVEFAQVGTGTVSPNVTQTRLQTFVASARTNGYNSYTYVNKGAPNYEGESVYQYVFTQGDVVGNITEVGTTNKPGNTSNLFSRTLIVDEQGVPTSLPIVALDKLTIYYKLTVFPAITDGSGSFVLSGVTYNYTSRGSLLSTVSNSPYSLFVFSFSKMSTFKTVAESQNALSDLTTEPNIVGNYNSNVITHEPYISGTYKSYSTVKLGIFDSNFPIRMFTAGFAMQTQFLLDKPIPKTNTNELTLRLSFSWSRR